MIKGKGNMSNPFDQKANSFGSFGLSPGPGEAGDHSRAGDESAFGAVMMGSFPRGDRMSNTGQLIGYSYLFC